ncbi:MULTISPECIES: type II secretion system F family protein [Rhodococcus erythropolis group]|uniref:Type II secretion system F family protein n=1 Tax=Rhodococcus baikonurensis TaxID=172041 RepID=A0ABV5XFZ0_9NOCA|nr:type II secretion system F family protein [Rhodococcus qingshengii]KLN71774.1 hypothetical protein ABM90_10115 [Rhodococcus erythropolis]MBP1054093.1 type II secretion system F family protein [Rhodococcus qingshengii]
MTFQIQAALLAVVLCVGLICLFLRFAPAQASLSEVLDNLGAHRATDKPADINVDESVRGKVGRRVLPYTADSTILKIPRSDLAILKISVPYFLGDKVLSALVGLLFFPTANLALTVLGNGLPWGIPTILSLGAGAVCFIAPDIEVRKKAAAAREEFGRSLGAYIEFVALNRTGGVGAVQSLERAAAVGDSWVFRRLDEELMRAQRSGQAPWDTLTRISGELELPDLADLADIMTLTGEQGASVAVTLSARASALRNAQLSDELGKAGSSTEKIQAPLALIGIVFMVMLFIPAMSSIILGSS